MVEAAGLWDLEDSAKKESGSWEAARWKEGKTEDTWQTDKGPTSAHCVRWRTQAQRPSEKGKETRELTCQLITRQSHLW